MSVSVRPWKIPGKFMVDVYFVWPDGSPFRYRKVMDFRSEASARKWGKQCEAEKRDAGKPSPAPANGVAPTWDEFWLKFIADGEGNLEKQSSLTSKRGINRTHLSPAFGKLALDCITDQCVSQFRAGLAKREGRRGGLLTLKTITNIMTVLNAALKLAVRWRVLAAMPCIIEIQQVSEARPEFYDFDDYARLCEGAEKVGSREAVLVRLAGDGGLRRGEIMALRWTDVDFRRRQLRVEQAAWQHSRKAAKELDVTEITRIAKPKGGRGRVVPMTQALYDALQAHRRIGVVYVLSQDDGTITPGHVLRDWLEAAQRRAKLVELGALHKLRHTFCSHLAMRGAPAKAIQELAGHTSLVMTMKYMHLSPSALDAAIHLLDVRDGEKSSGNALATARR